MPQIADVFATPQWIARLDQAANIIVAVAPFAALWIDALHQLPGDDFLLPAVTEGVDVFVDLVEGAPVVMVLATEAVGDVGFAAFQVVFESILFAVAAPVGCGLKMGFCKFKVSVLYRVLVFIPTCCSG